MYPTLALHSLLLFLALSNLNIHLPYDSPSQNQDHSQSNDTKRNIFLLINGIESRFSQVLCLGSTSARVTKCSSNNRRYDLHVHIVVQTSMLYLAKDHKNNASEQENVHGYVHGELNRHSIELWNVCKLVWNLSTFHMGCNGPNKFIDGVANDMHRPNERHQPFKTIVHTLFVSV